MALAKMLSENMPNAKTMLSMAASVAASVVVVRSVAHEYLPMELRGYFTSYIHGFFQRFSTQFTIVIDEYRGHSLNQVFESAEIYLGTKVTTSSTQRVRLGKLENEKNLGISMDRNEEMIDVFENVEVKWRLVCIKVESKGHGQHQLNNLNSSMRSELRSYELSFHKEHKEKIINSYLPYILEKAKAIKEGGKIIKLYIIDDHGSSWDYNTINLEHPMTFSTLAMDSELKKSLIEDLDNFVKGRQFYRRVGKAWKRGYLLYGPPGTGKSSLIAAMANYLNYNIYALDLAGVKSNSHLRYLLLSMSSRSILVIEDIDCSIKLQDREAENEPENDKEKVNTVTLSGLLNFIDGLWSCYGDERIIVFTTNHKNRLDPALLRPGRMDIHIHMSYCTFSAFEQLAFNYLGLTDHQLFGSIGEFLKEARVTPAEVAGELMKSTNAEVSLQGLLNFLEKKTKEKTEMSSSRVEKGNEEESESDDQGYHGLGFSFSKEMRGDARRRPRRRSFGARPLPAIGAPMSTACLPPLRPMGQIMGDYGPSHCGTQDLIGKMRLL